MATCSATRRQTAWTRTRPPQPTNGQAPHAVLDLAAVPTAPGCARSWIRQILSGSQLAHLSDTTELIVSELTTNAMLACRRYGRPFIRLILTLDRSELAVLVRDYCPGAPQSGHPGQDDENGRGLLLVEAVSGRCGWYLPDDGTPGKVVWAALSSRRDGVRPA